MPDPRPWHHQTLRDLAKALGTTSRSVELWREHGAPLTAEGPHNELAVRLWHLGHALTGKGKVKALKDPDPELVPYLAAARSAIEAATTAAGGNLDDPDRRIKDRQAHKLDLQNARAEGSMVRDAQTVFGRLLGQLQSEIRLAIAGKLLSEIWKAAQGKRQRLVVERDLRVILTKHFDQLIDAALEASTKAPTR